MKRGDDFEQFFEEAVSEVSDAEVEEKTKKFFEIISSEQVFEQLRQRFNELAIKRERDDQPTFELSPRDTTFFMYYLNFMYTLYMSMIDAWKED